MADGVSPSAGKDVLGPTAAANSVSRLDHYIASNGTLFNQKFHPSALSGRAGLENFVALIRSYFDQKGSHMQFNVVSRETLLDAAEVSRKIQAPRRACRGIQRPLYHAVAQFAGRHHQPYRTGIVNHG